MTGYAHKPAIFGSIYLNGDLKTGLFGLGAGGGTGDPAAGGGYKEGEGSVARGGGITVRTIMVANVSRIRVGKAPCVPGRARMGT